SVQPGALGSAGRAARWVGGIGGHRLRLPERGGMAHGPGAWSHPGRPRRSGLAPREAAPAPVRARRERALRRLGVAAGDLDAVPSLRRSRAWRIARGSALLGSGAREQLWVGAQGVAGLGAGAAGLGAGAAGLGAGAAGLGAGAAGRGAGAAGLGAGAAGLGAGAAGLGAGAAGLGAGAAGLGAGAAGLAGRLGVPEPGAGMPAGVGGCSPGS